MSSSDGFDINAIFGHDDDELLPLEEGSPPEPEILSGGRKRQAEAGGAPAGCRASLPTGSSESASARKESNNERNKRRIAEVRETVTELRLELVQQGALEPIEPAILAAGGRSLEMAMPKTKILTTVLQQLAHLHADNEKLRVQQWQLQIPLSELLRNVTPTNQWRSGNLSSTDSMSRSRAMSSCKMNHPGPSR